MDSNDCYKVLLLGQSGAGKTSFLNLIHNLEKIRSLPGAVGISLIESCNDASLERLPTSPMQSRTIGVKEYHIKFSDIDMHITDTPGYRDTEGPGKDEENFRTIQQAVQQDKRFDCCCLIINGRQPRETLHLHQMIQLYEILSRNLKTIIILTNIERKTQVSIGLKRLLNCKALQYYCIENPYCIVQNMKETPESFKDQELEESVRRSFEISDGTIKQIIQQIKSFRIVGGKHVIESKLLRLYHNIQ